MASERDASIDSLLTGSFADRARIRPSWRLLGFDLNRPLVGFGIALVAPVLLALAALASPHVVGRALAEPENVHEVFGRFLSAIFTAAAIAVSLAVLAISRDLHAPETQRRRATAALQYRHRFRASSGRDAAPLALGPFLAGILEVVGETAKNARRHLPEHPADRRVSVEGVTVEEFFEMLERRTADLIPRLREAGPRPDRLFLASVEFEEAITSHLARRFSRMPDFSEPTRRAMWTIHGGLRDYYSGMKYAKTLATQWGFSQMATSLLWSAVLGVIVSVAMALGYSAAALAVLGTRGADLLVAFALLWALLPLGLYVSYLARFVILNQFTFQVEAFVLGPDEPAVLELGIGEPRRGPRGATA